MNLATNFTILRIILAPFFLIFLLKQDFLLAFTIFLISILTDALDGFIARSRKQKTPFGSFLDPVADKLLLNGAFISLSCINLISWWVTIIVLSRDFVIATGWTLIYLQKKSFKVTPRLLGKITAILQMTVVPLILLQMTLELPRSAERIVWILMYIMVLVTIFSGIDYMVQGWGQMFKGAKN